MVVVELNYCARIFYLFTYFFVVAADIMEIFVLNLIQQDLKIMSNSPSIFPPT